MSTDGQGTNGVETLPKISTILSRVHEHYRRQTDRQTTDGRATAYSERSLKNCVYITVDNMTVQFGLTRTPSVEAALTPDTTPSQPLCVV